MFSRRTLIGLVSAVSIIATSSMVKADDQLYIPLVSKGFQHQFWQAVKQGADQAANESHSKGQIQKRRWIVRSTC
jgi:ribose transport system substrate-binding protein